MFGWFSSVFSSLHCISRFYRYCIWLLECRTQINAWPHLVASVAVYVSVIDSQCQIKTPGVGKRRRGPLAQVYSWMQFPKPSISYLHVAYHLCTDNIISASGMHGSWSMGAEDGTKVTPNNSSDTVMPICASLDYVEFGQIDMFYIIVCQIRGVGSTSGVQRLIHTTPGSI